MTTSGSRRSKTLSVSSGVEEDIGVDCGVGGGEDGDGGGVFIFSPRAASAMMSSMKRLQLPEEPEATVRPRSSKIDGVEVETSKDNSSVDADDIIGKNTNNSNNSNNNSVAANETSISIASRAHSDNKSLTTRPSNSSSATSLPAFPSPRPVPPPSNPSSATSSSSPRPLPQPSLKAQRSTSTTTLSISPRKVRQINDPIMPMLNILHKIIYIR